MRCDARAADKAASRAQVTRLIASTMSRIAHDQPDHITVHSKDDVGKLSRKETGISERPIAGTRSQRGDGK